MTETMTDDEAAAQTTLCRTGGHQGRLHKLAGWLTRTHGTDSEKHGLAFGLYAQRWIDPGQRRCSGCTLLRGRNRIAHSQKEATMKAKAKALKDAANTFLKALRTATLNGLLDEVAAGVAAGGPEHINIMCDTVGDLATMSSEDFQ